MLTCQALEQKPEGLHPSQRPEVRKLYNSSMDGVDKMDFLIQLYRIHIRSRKWPLRVIFHYSVCWYVAVNNGWLVYQRDADKLHVPKKKRHDLCSWTFNFVEALCKFGLSPPNRKRGWPSDSEGRPTKKRCCDRRPVRDVRYDALGYWPEIGDIQQRCKNDGCELRSKFVCVKCKVHFCLKQNSNCFTAFHMK